MRYYEVFVADYRYKSGQALTYSSLEPLKINQPVSVPLGARLASGFITAEVEKPNFKTKEIKTVLSETVLPAHSFELARWMADYYAAGLSEVLRLFAPSATSARRPAQDIRLLSVENPQIGLALPLTVDQKKAMSEIKASPSTTILLHGETATGKTRVYLELAKETLAAGRSVILLTPEIGLTSQLAEASKQLGAKTYVLHSQLGSAQRKRLWLAILEADHPVLVIGARSALFSPVHTPGLIVLDEAHEPAYKQDQTPRYQTSRAASQLGLIAGAKVVLGTATPQITDYFIASERQALVRMTQPAIKSQKLTLETEVVDIRQRQNFSRHNYLSNQLIDSISTTLSARKQIILYLNRRGSARIILCQRCGWQFLCPNCDVPLTYHGDSHLAMCHICGYKKAPPGSCPDCKNPDIIYRSIGSKALGEIVSRQFPNARLARFDSDNVRGERLNELYRELLNGKIDILVGTQILAKGLDLPKLGLVGIVSAETALALPDFSAEERAFQLLYQIMGRVGRGHTDGKVVIQSVNPGSELIKSAANRDYESFYKYSLKERKDFRWPPYSYLLKLTARRKTADGAENAAQNLRKALLGASLAIEIVGPSPSFYARRGPFYFWQLVIKAKKRSDLLKIASLVPAGWTIDLDPTDLL